MTSPPTVQKADQVAQQDTATYARNQAIEEIQTYKFTWKIENFSSLEIKKIFSNSFEFGGYKWRVLLFPKGNGSDYLSMYLDVTDSATLPHGWTTDMPFELVLINQLHSELTVRKATTHKFQDSESDWGFTLFMPLEVFNNSSRGFLVNDTCIIEADLSRPRQVLDNKINKLLTKDEKNGARDDQGCVLRAEEVDVLETLSHADATVKPVVEKREDQRLPATILAKMARVSTTASQDQIGLKSPSVIRLSSPPQQPITTKDCVSRAIQILEPHMSEDFLIIDDNQTADVTAGQALKRSLESFSCLLQAIEKYKIQLDIQSKKLDNLQKANNSLSIAKVEAEDALKAAEEKASVNEAESAALKAKLEEFQAKEFSLEAKIKTQKVKFEAELSSALKALETSQALTKAKEDELAEEKASRASEASSQKAKEKALDEFGAEIGYLVNKYHQLLAISGP